MAREAATIEGVSMLPRTSTADVEIELTLALAGHGNVTIPPREEARTFFKFHIQ
jgi:hypothetical protein